MKQNKEIRQKIKWKKSEKNWKKAKKLFLAINFWKKSGIFLWGADFYTSLAHAQSLFYWNLSIFGGTRFFGPKGTFSKLPNKLSVWPTSKKISPKKVRILGFRESGGNRKIDQNHDFRVLGFWGVWSIRLSKKAKGLDPTLMARPIGNCPHWFSAFIALSLRLSLLFQVISLDFCSLSLSLYSFCP